MAWARVDIEHLLLRHFPLNRYSCLALSTK